MTNQPTWTLLANLGDASPIEYGGYFVYEDSTGVYPPEAELLQSPEDDSGKWIAYRFILDQCTLTNGILSDNKFHPEYPAWFAENLSSVADSCGYTLDEIQSALCSPDAIERARAYESIGLHHGFDNLDSYPLELTRDEAIARYTD